MVKNKIIVIGFLFCLLSICACGQTNSESDVKEENNEALSNENISLKIWGASEDAALLEEICQRFESQNPGTNFSFTIEAVAESDCRGTVLADISNAPDVFTFADDQFSILCASGVLKEIPNGDEISSRNVSGAVDACKINNAMYAYPLTADNGYFLFYNKKYLSESDLSSFDTLLSKAEELEKLVTMDATSAWYGYSFFGNTGLTMGLNEDGRTNYCNWNDNTGDITGIDIAKAIMNLTANTAFKCGGDGDLVAGAKDDTVIAGVSGVWLSTDLQEAWGNNLGAVKLPTYTCAGKQVQLASYAGYKLVGVNSYSENLEWAHKFANFLTSEECQNLRFQMRQQGPSNVNSANSAEVLENPGIQAVIAQSEFASLQRVGNAFWSPMGDFLNTMVNQNPSGADLQELLDTLVKGITASN